MSGVRGRLLRIDADRQLELALVCTIGRYGSQHYVRLLRVLTDIAWHAGLPSLTFEWLRDGCSAWCPDDPLGEEFALRVGRIIDQGPLLEGQGHYGDGESPMCHPAFLDCALTDEGRSVFRECVRLRRSRHS